MSDLGEAAKEGARPRGALRVALSAVKRWLGTAWRLSGCTVLLFLLLDAGLNFLYGLDEERNHPCRRFAAYAGQPWVVPYVREELSVESRWAAYVNWRAGPVDGRYLHVDERGVRHTWNRPRAPDAPARPYRIYVFGGSTIWGTGVRDECTIPSWLSRILAEEDGQDVEVTNFGEIGYVSTQEVLLLFRLVQTGQEPDLAIFYDGVNDVFSAAQNRQAGLTQQEINRRREFNLLKHKDRALAAIFWGSDQQGVPRLAATLARRLLKRHEANATVPPALAGECADRYAANVKLAGLLAQAYGFKAVFYWQPSLFHRARKTAEEDHSEARLGFLKDFYMEVYRQVQDHPALKANPDFHYSAHLLDDREEACFIDYFHLSEAANGLVAAALARDIGPLIPRVR